MIGIAITLVQQYGIIGAVIAVDNLLLEDGSNLLLEDGCLIKLES